MKVKKILIITLSIIILEIICLVFLPIHPEISETIVGMAKIIWQVIIGFFVDSIWAKLVSCLIVYLFFNRLSGGKQNQIVKLISTIIGLFILFA